MRRRLFTLASLLSLLLCVATAFVWARSYRYEDAFPLDESHQVIVSRGGIELQLSYRTTPGFPFHVSHWSRSPAVSDLAHFRYLHESPAVFFLAPTTTIDCPIWVPVAVFIVHPTLWLIRRWMLRRRWKSNMCPICSYNLTGNTSGVCPECGTAIPQASNPDH